MTGLTILQSLTHAKVLMVHQAKNNDFIVRLKADEILLAAMPGQFLLCSTPNSDKEAVQIPAYFFSVNADANYCEIYFQQADAEKLKLSVTCKALFVSGIEGQAFILPKVDSATSSNTGRKPILIGDSYGLASMVFFAEQIKRICHVQPLVFLSLSDAEKNEFPFTPTPSQFVLSDFPLGVLAACPLLEDKKIPSRLISDSFLPGCYDGNLAEFLDELPASLFSDQEVDVFSLVEKKSTDIIRGFCEKHKLNWAMGLVVVPH